MSPLVVSKKGVKTLALRSDGGHGGSNKAGGGQEGCRGAETRAQKEARLLVAA